MIALYKLTTTKFRAGRVVSTKACLELSHTLRSKGDFSVTTRDVVKHVASKIIPCAALVVTSHNLTAVADHSGNACDFLPAARIHHLESIMTSNCMCGLRSVKSVFIWSRNESRSSSLKDFPRERSQHDCTILESALSSRTPKKYSTSRLIRWRHEISRSRRRTARCRYADVSRSCVTWKRGSRMEGIWWHSWRSTEKLGDKMSEAWLMMLSCDPSLEAW
jgi:hypothetical protein